MIHWGTQYPKLYNLFHKLWTSSVGTSDYNKSDWKCFDDDLSRAFRVAELLGIIKELEKMPGAPMCMENRRIRCQKELDELLKENQ